MANIFHIVKIVIVIYGPDIKDIKKKLDKIDEKIEDLKTIVKIIKNKMDGTIKIIENYHSIAQDMIKKYETFNSRLKNYQILKTINYLFISNREIINDIDNIINGNKSKDDWKKKCNILIDIIDGDRSDYKNENAKTNLNTDDSFYINKIYSEENYISITKKKKVIIFQVKEEFQMIKIVEKLSKKECNIIKVILVINDLV